MPLGKRRHRLMSHGSENAFMGRTSTDPAMALIDRRPRSLGTGLGDRSGASEGPSGSFKAEMIGAAETT